MPNYEIQTKNHVINKLKLEKLSLKAFNLRRHVKLISSFIFIIRRAY